MKKFTYILVLLTALSGMVSCTKVIEVDITQAPSKVVIEGELTQGLGPQVVHLSRSVGISDASLFPEVQGAVVVIADDEGNSATLYETQPGYYATDSLLGRPGHTYNLTVNVGAETFTASSTMPQAVVLDSVYNLQASMFGGMRFPIIVKIQDPGGSKDYYRFVSFVNGNRQEGSIVTNDDLFDGQLTEVFLPGLGAQLRPGDTLSLEMQCIDAGVYEYFSSFGINQGPGSGSAPANPYSNILGGAIGYFNACATDSKTIVIR